MSYPSSIDSFPTVSTGDIVEASTTNSITTAIVAVENALGTNPFGEFSTVGAAIVSLTETVSPAVPLFYVENFV